MVLVLLALKTRYGTPLPGHAPVASVLLAEAGHMLPHRFIS